MWSKFGQLIEVIEFQNNVTILYGSICATLALSALLIKELKRPELKTENLWTTYEINQEKVLSQRRFYLFDCSFIRPD